MRRGERRASRRASVLDVDERDSGQAQRGNRRVGVAGGIGATSGEIDLFPADTRLGQRSSGGDRRHLQPGHAGMAPERMDADTDDPDVAAPAHPAGPSGATAYVTTPSPP